MRANITVHGHPMNFSGMEGTIKEVEVTLSRRNLLSLLHKLDWEDSERTLQKHLYPSEILLTVMAEDDEEHYGDREAGVMHEKTERFIEQQAEVRREPRERVESEEALAYASGILESWPPSFMNLTGHGSDGENQ
jgi:hypothetical protein